MKKYFLFAGLLFILSSCSVGSDYEELKGEITEINSPETVSVGEVSLIEVKFSGGTNGCAFASRLATEWNNDGIQIESYYFYPKNPNICPEYVPVHILYFTIQPDAPGELILRANDSGLVADTIQVLAK